MPAAKWGNSTWKFFHTLAERLDTEAPREVVTSLFTLFVQICKFLPCPSCAEHAYRTLSRVSPRECSTKQELVNIMYLFHNQVNARRKVPLFNYADMSHYKTLNISLVVNEFIQRYQTRGNMQFIAESFQRELIVQSVIHWIRSNVAYLPGVALSR
jgi:hypothetical protein